VKYSDLLKASDTGDLKLLIDSIAVFWLGIPKAERRSKSELADMVDSVVSFRRKLDGVSEEQQTALRRSVKHILRAVADLDPDDIVEESHVVRHGTPLDDGMYWLFSDGVYIACDDHYNFVVENQDTFIEILGLDAWKVMHARHRDGGELMRLMLSSGAVAVQIYDSGKKRKAKYQCCQCSLSWVKKKIAKMPMISSIVRVYDPAKPYDGFSSGIKFILHR
jgi:hypothetical protein